MTDLRDGDRELQLANPKSPLLPAARMLIWPSGLPELGQPRQRVRGALGQRERGLPGGNGWAKCGLKTEVTAREDQAHICSRIRISIFFPPGNGYAVCNRSGPLACPV